MVKVPTPPPTRNRGKQPSDPLDAPSRTPVPRLERVKSGEGLVDPESRLNHYVHNEPPVVESPGAVPWASPDEGVLRDNPFGSTPFGGETPFFTDSGGTTPAFENDDTEGIPCGLPDLLDLPDEVPEVPRAAEPPRAHTETLVPVDEDVDPATPAPLPPRISADPPAGPPPLQMFLLGLGVASAAWLLVIFAWAWLTFAA